MSYRIRIKGEAGRGKERIGGIAFDILHPSLSVPPSHPFNPATAAGAILMPLNADEVKMCLKERNPVGRAAACMHGVRNTHTHCTLHMWELGSSKHSFHVH